MTILAGWLAVQEFGIVIRILPGDSDETLPIGLGHSGHEGRLALSGSWREARFDCAHRRGGTSHEGAKGDAAPIATGNSQPYPFALRATGGGLSRGGGRIQTTDIAGVKAGKGLAAQRILKKCRAMSREQFLLSEVAGE